MFKLIAFIVLLVHVFATPLPDSGRIVGGSDAKPGEIKYIISLRSYNSHSCGGSIVDAWHILTAAHCVDGASPSRLSVQYGVLQISSDNFQSINVESVNVHEEYSPWLNYANDVAVLKLTEPLPLSDDIVPVTLPEQGEAPPGDTWGVLAGWGLPFTGGSVMKNLQRVDILIYTDENCSKAHGSSVNAKYHVCSGVPEGGKGQCSGDSGGPLVAGGKQVGVVSWSVKPCTVKGYPGVFARVGSYVDWINQQVSL